MKVKLLFIIAIVGIILGLISVFVYNASAKNLPPISISYNPYENGIYATGILESNQKHGDNINIFPEISGKVIAIYAEDGQTVKKGDPVVYVDDSVEKSIVAKDKASADAAFSLLQRLKAEPRKEDLDVAKAQLDYANANLKNVQAQLDKIQKAYKLDKKSISKNDLDNAINAVSIAKQSLEVAQNQYNLVKAGAWSYDVINQTSQYLALVETYRSDKALLDKYLIKAPIDGVILRINTAVGDYISPAGSYGTFTQNMTPVVEMGVVNPYLEVKCFLDEILVPRLPEPSKMEAKMFIRGENNKSIPLEFVKIQPYTIPKIELSNQTQEKVDVRVLPVVFRFKKPTDINLYPGQLVDIYIRGKK